MRFAEPHCRLTSSLFCMLYVDVGVARHCMLARCALSKYDHNIRVWDVFGKGADARSIEMQETLCTVVRYDRLRTDTRTTVTADRYPKEKNVCRQSCETASKQSKRPYCEVRIAKSKKRNGERANTQVG